MTIDWYEPVELVEVSSGVVVPTAEPTEYIGPAVGQPHYSHAVRAWGKVYLVAHDGEIQGYREFRIRNVREPQYRPYSPDELAALVGTAVRHKASDSVMLTAHYAQRHVTLYGNRIYNATQLMDNYIHLDGTPCGVLVEADDES